MTQIENQGYFNFLIFIYFFVYFWLYASRWEAVDFLSVFCFKQKNYSISVFPLSTSDMVQVGFPCQSGDKPFKLALRQQTNLTYNYGTTQP